MSLMLPPPIIALVSFTWVNVHKYTKLSLPWLASLLPEGENYTAQTSSLCFLSTAMHLVGSIDSEHLWSSNSEYCVWYTLWYLQLRIYWVMACLHRSLRRLGWIITVEGISYWILCRSAYLPCSSLPFHCALYLSSLLIKFFCKWLLQLVPSSTIPSLFTF